MVDSQSTVLRTPEACLQTNGISRKKPGEKCTLIPVYFKMAEIMYKRSGILWHTLLGGRQTKEVQGGKLESRSEFEDKLGGLNLDFVGWPS